MGFFPGVGVMLCAVLGRGAHPATAAATRVCSAVTAARAEAMAPCCQAMAWLRWSPAK